MVDYSDIRLDLAFSALSDPTRRAIIERLARERSLAVTEIAAPFSVSLPAVMKHLDVLARAGLIERNKTGRTVHCRLSAAPMETAMEWLQRYQQFWTTRLEALAELVEENPCPPSRSQASRSSARSGRPPRKSSRRGPGRKH